MNLNDLLDTTIKSNSDFKKARRSLTSVSRMSSWCSNNKRSQLDIERRKQKKYIRRIYYRRIQDINNNKSLVHYPFQYHRYMLNNQQHSEAFIKDCKKFSHIFNIIKRKFIEDDYFRVSLRYVEKLRYLYDMLISQFTGPVLENFLQKEYEIFKDLAITRVDRHYNVNIFASSNLWYDRNNCQDYSFYEKFPKFTSMLFAGNIADDVNQMKNFFTKNISRRRTYFVLGDYYMNKNEPIQDIISNLKKSYSYNRTNRRFCKHVFLDNDWTWMDSTNNYNDKHTIAIIGVNGWVDFTYGNNGNIELNKSIMQSQLDKHKFGFYREEDGTVVPLTPDHYVKMHEESMKAIDRCYNEILSINPEAIIILLTYYPLSAKCISEEHKDDLINAIFVNNKPDDWFKKYSHIKYIVSGYANNSSDFIMYKDTYYEKRYIINPYKNNENFNKKQIVNIHSSIIKSANKTKLINKYKNITKMDYLKCT